MSIFKNSILPILGMIALITIMTYSYLNNSVFFDKLLVCSIVLGVVFFLRIQENLPISETSGNELDQLNKK
ncbi:hypothetical protein [Christiangramia sabulilitoris]|uniref:Uncharacterized protein n=1 Tax=Christiangramia sabulilitoris TaxID=2583991 RepID=A0A550I7M4_9FLAO|nr:hypothetical protein [Christiangramia sabulilitoris]TRO66976.1 hypothetical protein FGM01_03545 [Christiangramia sabulilitoris]